MKKYPAYKYSGIEWLGLIPKHWEAKQLKYLIKGLVSGVSVNSTDVPANDDQLGILKTSCVYNYSFNPEENKAVIMEEYDRVACPVSKDSIIISRMNTPELVGASGYVPKDYPNLFLPDRLWKTIFHDGLNINVKWLSHLLISDLYRKMLSSRATGTSPSMKNISKEDFLTMIVPVPPLSEQISITAYLDIKTQQIDTLIHNKEKLIALLQEERTALINQAVTKGLNPDVPMKDSGIEGLGEIPEHWEVKKLKYVSKINPSSPSYSFDRASDKEVVFLPMEKVSEEGIVKQDLRRSISDVSSGFTYFEKDDVIVAKITPCFENGKGALLFDLQTNFGYGSTEYHTIRAGEGILKEFLYYITRSERFMTLGEAFMTGSAGQKRVPTSFVQNFYTCVPPLEEQSQIVDFIKDEFLRFNHIIFKAKQEIDLLKEYKTTLISEVVTGKLDVREEVLELA